VFCNVLHRTITLTYKCCLFQNIDISKLSEEDKWR